MTADPLLPARAELERLFQNKYVAADGSVGVGPARRRRYGYFTPDDIYEATVGKLLPAGGRWLDVGGGRDVFPSNPRLAATLAARAGRLVAVDPSPNVHSNPLAHERHESLLEGYEASLPFHLLTLRMVAEHVTDPPAFVAALARLTAPGGRVVVYTVTRLSPLTLAAGAVPFRLHHPLKRLVWGTEDRDTFPVAYKMNTWRALRTLFARQGMVEAAFARLDDARTLARFRSANHLELAGVRACRAVGLPYPEGCLLGVYEKPAASTV